MILTYDVELGLFSMFFPNCCFIMENFEIEEPKSYLIRTPSICGIRWKSVWILKTQITQKFVVSALCCAFLSNVYTYVCKMTTTNYEYIYNYCMDAFWTFLRFRYVRSIYVAESDWCFRYDRVHESWLTVRIL